MKNTFPRFLNKLWHILAALIILSALLVSISGLLAPVLNEHRQEIEKLASDLVKTPVKIEAIKISWHAYEPELSLQNVTVFDATSQKVKLSLQQLDINFNIWRSLLTRQLSMESLTISGVDLTVRQLPSNELQIGNLATINLKELMENTSSENDGISQWVFSQPGLIFQNINLRIALPDKNYSVTLKRASLINKEDKHEISSRLVLNQAAPTRFTVHLEWMGDIKNMKSSEGHLYCHAQNLSLAQWFTGQTWGGFRVVQGLVDTRVNINWSHNQVDQLRSEFAGKDLELYSLVLKRPEVIQSVKGQVGWQLTGNKQEMMGEKIKIDFPASSWPETHFNAIVTNNPQGGVRLDNLQFNYLNLADTVRVILESNLISDETRKSLLASQPEGEVRDVVMTMTGGFDPKQITLTGTVNNASLKPWDNFPGVKNVTGVINWNGRQGNIVINSTQMALMINQLFTKPLLFSNVVSNLNISLSEQGDWMFDAPNLHLDNPDITLDARLKFTLPKIASPHINFVANFALLNVAHVARYLPQKALDPDLNEWLQNAFISGQADGGKVVVQGNVADFPFDTQPNSGKFFVTAKLKNIDFRFAPDWPHIKNTHGVLTFSGSSMTADIATGELLGIPVVNVRGVIPYLGEKAPQILNVTAAIQTDIANGLHFIQESPLQKTIGKKLAPMQLVGPMKLKLNLEVPLRNPDDTRVNGEASLTNGLLILPAWKLKLSELNGGFSFTEDGLEAKEMRGNLLGNPALLQITTLRQVGKPGQVRADLSSVMDISHLQQWLDIDVSLLAKGITPYQIQLFLSSQTDKSQQDRAVLSSNLKGVSLNLPTPYGKKAEEEKKLQIAIDLSEGKALNTKIDLGNVANAAITFHKDKQGLSFFGGELRLGNKMANWQAAPGLLITGDIPELNIALWKTYVTSLGGSSATRSFSWRLFRGIDLNADVINAMGTELHHANLQAERSDSAWQLKIDSQEVAGELALPFDWGSQAIDGHFQRLTIISSDVKETNRSIDPRSVPPMALEIDNVNYNDMKLGHVYLTIAPMSTGLSIKQLAIEEPSVKLTATGTWTGNANTSMTKLTGQMSAPKIGDLLTQWGFNSSILVGSTADVKFDLQWAGAAYQPSLAKLTGNVSVKLGKGRIINLSESTNSKMGLGRLLNILSLSTIPRRLSLDFSDLFEQGYSFDFMNSKFSFREGNAFIDSMQFDGPVSGVILKGRVGLVARDLDIQLGLSPHVTGSLPVVAAIAGGPVVGPAVGVATWLVDRMVSRQVSKSVHYEYLITGPWDNPAWQKIDAYGRAVPN